MVVVSDDDDDDGGGVGVVTRVTIEVRHHFPVGFLLWPLPKTEFREKKRQLPGEIFLWRTSGYTINIQGANDDTKKPFPTIRE